MQPTRSLSLHLETVRLLTPEEAAGVDGAVIFTTSRIYCGEPPATDLCVMQTWACW